MNRWLLLIVGTAAAVGAHYLPVLPGTETLIALIGALMAGRSTAITPVEDESR